MVGWILDIIVLAVFVLLIIKGYKNGLVRSLVVIVGNIVALFLAFYIGKYLAGVIYDMSVRNAIVGYV
ncbi:MAG: CvpA family protein, partial [Oscillospiraceae bacterium]